MRTVNRIRLVSMAVLVSGLFIALGEQRVPKTTATGAVMTVISVAIIIGT